MAQVLKFARNPNLPVLSNWVVDFDAFFDTGVPVLDSVLASELENLPGNWPRSRHPRRNVRHQAQGWHSVCQNKYGIGLHRRPATDQLLENLRRSTEPDIATDARHVECSSRQCAWKIALTI